MAKLPVTKPPKPGFNPAAGFPDPNAEVVAASQVTHRPNPNGGTICGVKPIPIHAGHYSMENPSCPVCKDWLDKTRAATYRVYGQPQAHGSSALESADTSRPPSPEDS
jgi:hypothetical protein